MLAEAHAELGQWNEGLICLIRGEQIIEENEERSVAAEVHRLRADILYATGDLQAAESNYDRAVLISSRQSAKIFELRAATSLARLWRDQGKRVEARDLLAPVYSISRLG